MNLFLESHRLPYLYISEFELRLLSLYLVAFPEDEFSGKADQG